jgi:glutaredoxin
MIPYCGLQNPGLQAGPTELPGVKFGSKKQRRCLIATNRAVYLVAASVPAYRTSMNIKAYLKPSCGWSNGVRAVLRKHALDYDDIDIIGNRASYEEMVRKSGQPLSPCVEIDGVMLADVSGEEVENYLLSNELVRPTEAAAGVPTNAGCSDDEHAKMATKTVRFF